MYSEDYHDLSSDEWIAEKIKFKSSVATFSPWQKEKQVSEKIKLFIEKRNSKSRRNRQGE
jgi:hypothetical protein